MQTKWFFVLLPSYIPRCPFRDIFLRKVFCGFFSVFMVSFEKKGQGKCYNMNIIMLIYNKIQR